MVLSTRKSTSIALGSTVPNKSITRDKKKLSVLRVKTTIQTVKKISEHLRKRK